MAKHKTRSRSLALYRAPRVARPMVIRTTVIKKAKRHHHRRHGGGGVRGLMSKERMGIVAGAFVVGLLEKQGIMASLPKLPLIGTTGTIGVAAYLLSDGGKNRLADEVCTAALVLAAHSLSATGSIVGGDYGDGDVGYVAGW